MSENKNIAQYGKVKEFGTNEFVFLQGSNGEEMHIVLQGKFGVYLNSMSDFPLKVSEINPGSFFGEMALIDNEPRSATVISEDSSKTLCIGKKDFLPFLAQNTQITTSILKTLGFRYQSTYSQLESLGKSTDKLKKYDKIDDEIVAKIIALGSETAYKYMQSFSKLLRLANERLLQDEVSNEKPQTVQIDSEEEFSLLKEKVNLLPEDYTEFKKKTPTTYANYVYEKLTKCFVCDHTYDMAFPNHGKLITTKNDYDFRQHHKDFDILWYSTNVCPKCNYTTLTTAHKNSNPDVYKLIKSENFKKNVENFGEFPANRTIDQVIKSYYLAKLCNRLTENDILTEAKIMVRLYWLYKDLNAKKLQLEAAKEALECYEKYALTSASLSDLNLVQINIIMAEIYVEMGEYLRARTLYHKNLTLGKKVHAALYAQSEDRFQELKIMQKKV